MAAKKRSTTSLAELEALPPEALDEQMARKIAAVYAESKDIYLRNLCRKPIRLRSPAETKRMLDEFFAAHDSPRRT